MKFVEVLIIAIISSVVGGLVTYFSGLFPLPFAIVILFLILLFVINLYSIPEVNTRISELEKNTGAHSLTIRAINDALANIRKSLIEHKKITMTDFVGAFDKAIIGISDTIVDEYFSMHGGKSGNPHAYREQTIAACGLRCLLEC